MAAYYGKYRGKVVDPLDPNGLGMVKVTVPDVLGDVALWAMPCVPYAGPKVGWLFVPPKSANVWVEFEAGNPEFPIWSGGFWGSGEDSLTGASTSTGPDVKVLKTDTFALTIDHSQGKNTAIFELNIGSQESPRLLRIQLSPNGVELANEQKTTATLTADEIQLTNGASTTVVVAADHVQLKSEAASVTAASGGVTLQLNPARVALSSSGVQLSNGRPSVKLNQTSVVVNDGALQVT
jgi:uncharacterized protein involved in type VI secretion and phage assembly